MFQRQEHRLKPDHAPRPAIDHRQELAAKASLEGFALHDHSSKTAAACV
jgi:hypothetical protein